VKQKQQQEKPLNTCFDLPFNPGVLSQMELNLFYLMSFFFKKKNYPSIEPTSEVKKVAK
jgi:hypothetical protein